jgi:hypothetical protein
MMRHNRKRPVQIARQRAWEVAYWPGSRQTWRTGKSTGLLRRLRSHLVGPCFVAETALLLHNNRKGLVFRRRR